MKVSESNKTEEEQGEKEENTNQLQYKNTIENNSVQNVSDKTIKELLKLCPSYCKETKIFCTTLDKLTVEEAYNKILTMKLTNKELLYFLNIMNKFPKNIEIDNLLYIKAQSTDKYISQVMVSYFTLCIKYFYNTGEFSSSLSYKHKIQIYLRFLYVFENDLSKEMAVYNAFKMFLREEYLKPFLTNKSYRKFPFLKEFLVDFSDRMKEETVRIGYECEEYRPLVFSLYSNPWIYSWSNWHKLSHTFYYRSLQPFTEGEIEKDLEEIDDFYEELLVELEEYENLNFDKISVKYYDDFIGRKIREKREFLNVILEINQNRKIPEDADLRKIRLCKGISLAAVGEFLCKERNIEMLQKWTETFDFREMNILKALRLFLESFQMSGESQVISRVLTVFTEKYVGGERNLIEAHFKVAYSFIFLNTMLYKANIEKRMSFDEYYSKAENEVYKQEEMREFYDQIRSKEIKMPIEWVDGFDKFLLYKAVSEEEQQIDFNSSEAIISCYKHIFLNNLEYFYSMEVEKFFKLCTLFDQRAVFTGFLSRMEGNLSKMLQGMKCLFQSEILCEDLTNKFAFLLEKIERPKTQSVLKNLFVSKGKIQVLSPFASLFTELCNCRFESGEICNMNLKSLSKVENQFVGSFVNILMVENASLVSDLSFVDSSIKMKIVGKNHEKINLLSTAEKFEFYKLYFQHERPLTDCIYNQFMQCVLSDFQINKQLNNETDAFSAYCTASSLLEVDDFYKVIFVKENLGGFCEKKEVFYEEVFQGELSNFENVLRFFNANHKSVFNLKFAKNIHRDCCPLKIAEFCDMHKIGYLLAKMSFFSDSKVSNYTFYVLNYLSDSLVLFSRIISFVTTHSFYINSKEAVINIKLLMKILNSRIKNTNKICCDKFEGDFSTKEFANNLYKLGYVNKSTIDLLEKLDGNKNNNDIEHNNETSQKIYEL
ncbi:hypothetical protein NUSPORA_02224 [Nucleospora cyclopteri]